MAAVAVSGYAPSLKGHDVLSPEDVAQARRRRREAMGLQEIEGSPLTPEDIAMFERGAWFRERRRVYQTLRNKFGVRDAAQLDKIERLAVAQRTIRAKARSACNTPASRPTMTLA